MALLRLKRTQCKPWPPKYNIQPESKILVSLYPTPKGPKETPYVERKSMHYIQPVNEEAQYQHTESQSSPK